MPTMEQMAKGNYFGTEVDGRWWRRYRRDGLFARGNGEFWMDGDGLHFLRLLTRSPIDIAWAEITGVRLGRWHAGRWGAGHPILKVDFERRHLRLTAGFLLSRSWPEMEGLTADLRDRVVGSG
jgi:hypothetical protein